MTTKIHTCNYRWALIALVPLLLLAALLLGGCASASRSGGTVTLPALPTWQAPRVERAEFTAWDVQIHAAALAPGATVDLTDTTFTILNHETMLELLRWTDAIYRARSRGRNPYTPEAWDCDKFAKAYTLAVELCAGDAGVKAQPLAARVYVEQRAEFGGVGGTVAGRHAVVGARTDRGYYVIEPQPGALIGVRVVPLAEYPNKIFRLRIGG